MRYFLVEYRSGFCLEVGKDFDQAKLSLTMVMACSTTKVGVLDRSSVHDMRMREEADTRVVTAEEQ